MNESKIISFRLRNPRSEQYLSGYATMMEIAGGRILLKDRRIPWTKFIDGAPVEYAQLLGDLEYPSDNDGGWAAWGNPEPIPEWWNRVGADHDSAKPAPGPSDEPPADGI